MTIERHNNVIHGHAQLFRRGADNAQVRLMRYQPVQSRALQIVRFQRFVDNMGQFCYRNLEHFIACHRQVNGVIRIDTIGIRQRQQFAITSISM
ncbi:hypothetical protein D3C76_1649530 [compost metagenome]